MTDRPSYLALLNRYAVDESRGYHFFSAWADATPHTELGEALRTVAAREREHGASFARRIEELGFEVEPFDSPVFAGMMAIVTSDRPDLEKFDTVPSITNDGPDVWDDVFRDHSIDIRTGELLGRHIAEERDSLRLLRGCLEQLRSRENAASSE